MDANTFDAVVKVVSSSGTRRSVLRALVAGLIAGRLGQQGVAAQERTPEFCGHATGPNGGCKGACTSAGFTGSECNPICGTGQFVGLCPVGQGGNDPCCNPGLCNPDNFERVNGIPVYTGPMKGCLCGHSVGPSGGCMEACTKAGFMGNQCNDICGNGQTTGACPVGQGGDNPCCNPGYCGPTNFEQNASGNPVYTGPTTGCPPVTR